MKQINQTNSSREMPSALLSHRDQKNLSREISSSSHRDHTGLRKKLFERSSANRTLFFLVCDGILFSLSLYFAFHLRFEGAIPEVYFQNYYIYFPAFVGIKILSFVCFQIYRFAWTYVGLFELLKLLKAQAVTLLLIPTFIFYFTYDGSLRGFPRSIFLIDFAISLILVGGLRISRRVFMEVRKDRSLGKKRTLIIGAGNAGEQIVRDIKRVPGFPYLPVGFIDDNPSKEMVSIHGIKVLGKREEIPRIAEKVGVDLAIIAMPSAPSREIREIVSYLHKAGIKDIHIIPGTKEIMSRNISILDIKTIDLNDLLSREHVDIDYAQVENYLRGKRVLVTGAGGSIGSELAKQVSEFKPELLVLLDFDETALFYIDREIKDNKPNLQVEPVLADVLDREKMTGLYERYMPQVVFHAAAYKHVPMIEKFPEEGIKVNVLGTKLMSELAQRYQVEKFIFISSDKAVNPTSLMGASKRLAEMWITHLNHKETTHFLAVRFGNVLGSRGSVIPTFQEQIKRGGPVTVTHPDMQRYFMTIPEAVLLVLQAGALGKGGEVFVLDMGDPVKVYDVACELIRLSGLEPDKDIPIIFTGIRPGEKLFEEVLSAEEGVEPTIHPKIFKAKIKNSFDEELLNARIETLAKVSRIPDKSQIITTFQELIPTYHPNSSDPP